MPPRRRAATAVAEKPAAPARRTRQKAKPQPEVELEEEIDELDEDDVEEDEIEDEEPEEKPAPKRRGRPAKTPAAAEKPARRRKAAPEPEPEDDDEDDDELEDLEDEPEEKPKAKRKPPARTAIEFDTKWLAAHINRQLGTNISTYTLRDLIRRLARKGEVQREVGTDRARYEWTGPKDPAVKVIMAAVKRGDTDKAKTEKLDNLKKARAAKGKKKPAPEPVEEIEDDELEDDELEDLEDE